MQHDTLAVYTRNNPDDLIAKGYTGDWRCNAENLPDVKYIMIVSQNPTDRGRVRVFAKVDSVQVVKYEGERDRYRFHFSEFVTPGSHIAWNSTSPIRYFKSDELMWDVKALSWDTVRNFRRNRLDRYVKMISEDLGVAPEAVEITVNLA